MLHKCSQTEEFHHFVIAKRDRTVLFGLLGAVFLKGGLQNTRYLRGFALPRDQKYDFVCFYDFGSLGGSWAVLGASWGPSLGSFWTSWGQLELMLALLGPLGAHSGLAGACWS